MNMDTVEARGLVLLGCGKMGSAMLAGWLKGGLPVASVWVIEPNPSDWLKAAGVRLNAALPASPAIVLVAVKPQMMGAALPAIAAMGGGGTLVLSVAAGTTIATYQGVFGTGTPIVRAMPNTPAAIGKGITAICGNALATEDHLALAEALLSAVGQVVRVDGEHQMDAVTAVSGSGPAYVFHLIETLAAAGAAVTVACAALRDCPPTLPCSSPRRPLRAPARWPKHRAKAPHSFASTSPRPAVRPQRRWRCSWTKKPASRRFCGAP